MAGGCSDEDKGERDRVGVKFVVPCHTGIKDETFGEGSEMPRIDWVEDADAQGLLADLYAVARENSPTGDVPAIYRTMSQRPDFLAAIMAAAPMHFSDGALSRAQHEMIASYVSALNRCHY